MLIFEDAGMREKSVDDIISRISATFQNKQYLSRVAKLHNWDLSRSYRVPGKVYEAKKAAVFDLTKAEAIEH